MKKQKEKKDEKTNPEKQLEKPKIIEIQDPQIKTNEKKDEIEAMKENIKPVEVINTSPSISLSQQKIDPKFTAISTYNGDSCDQYNWSQGSNDVSIQINLLENTSANKVL